MRCIIPFKSTDLGKNRHIFCPSFARGGGGCVWFCSCRNLREKGGETGYSGLANAFFGVIRIEERRQRLRAPVFALCVYLRGQSFRMLSDLLRHIHIMEWMINR